MNKGPTLLDGDLPVSNLASHVRREWITKGGERREGEPGGLKQDESALRFQLTNSL